jgi:hypothetical protein
MHYILDGKVPVPVDMMTWAMWFENHRQDRIVKQENVAQFWVSTVFLGLDHNWGDGPPLLFETMVFDRGDNAENRNLDCWMERTSTWELALEAHERGDIWAKEQLQ